MSNRKILITAFALSSTLAFCLQPGWSQTSGGSSSGSSSQGLGTGSSGSGTSGSTGNSGSISRRSGSSSAHSSADCPDGSIASGKGSSGSFSSTSKSSSGSTEVRAVLDAAAAQEWAAAQGAAGLPVNTNGVFRSPRSTEVRIRPITASATEARG